MEGKQAYHKLPFLFERKYFFWRHFLFWTVHLIFFTFLFWRDPKTSFPHQFILSLAWLPGMMLYSYPVIYYFIPRFLLKEKYLAFTMIILLWAVGGWFFNYAYRAYVMTPFVSHFRLKGFSTTLWAPASYLTLAINMSACAVIKLFQFWLKKQGELLTAEKEKVQAELQLLKAQVHPHFLFNTLNNIYAFSLEKSEKTPAMIFQLSSLLRYVLYQCSGDKVSLAKEIEVMQHYVALESARYGSRIDLSFEVTGQRPEHMISPLLLLPLIENAFKHGAAEQLEKPWLTISIHIGPDRLHAKLVNSLANPDPARAPGIGLTNLRKRLEHLYPGQHQLDIHLDHDFFVANLLVPLHPISNFALTPTAVYDTPLPAH